MKDYCVRLIKNVLFCLQFFPPVYCLSTLSAQLSVESQPWEHRGDGINAENELEENRDARKTAWLADGGRKLKGEEVTLHRQLASSESLTPDLP